MGKNLLPSTSFEINTDGWSVLGVPQPHVVTGGPVWDGLSALEVTGIATDNWLAYGYNPADQLSYLKVYGIPVTAGVAYTYSFYAYYDIDLSGAAWRPRINWYDAAGGILLSSDGTTQNIGTTYSRIVMIAVAPAGAAYALPSMQRKNDAQPGHSNRVDALQFEVGAAATAYQRAQFEPMPGLLCPDYGYIFRNFLFGTGTDFIVEKQDGLQTMPSIRNGGVERENDHGSIPGFLYYSDRIVQFDLKVLGDYGTEIANKVSFLRKTFQAPAVRSGRTEEPLYFKRPGQPIKYVNVRCTKRDLPSDYLGAMGLVTASVELQATDPTIFSAVGSTGTITALAGATAAASVQMAMNGDHADGAYPILVINGPSTNPIVGNASDDNRQLKLLIALTAGQKVRVNMKTQKVEKDVGAGYVEDYTIVKSDSQWWKLRPGLNQITYNRAAGNTGVDSAVTLTWNDSWA